MTVSNIKHWVFDLDNTLYPPSARLFDEIEQRMETFIMREIGVDRARAKKLRADFWKSHGTTLAGLMDVYAIEPHGFLDEVHQIDLSAISPEPGLNAAIGALNGSRVIYTNGSRGHGENVSRARGIRDAFQAVYGIEDAAFSPKPNMDAFLRIFDQAGIDPTAAVMFEDDPRNLLAPAELGMTTVLVGNAAAGDHVHHQTTDLAGFLNEIVRCGFPPR